MERPNWYVIQVLTGAEQNTCRTISQMVDPDILEQAFVPMAQIRKKSNGRFETVESPLFPGYLFVITPHIEEVRAALWKVASFTRLLKAGTTPVPLEPEEVEAYRRLSDEGHCVSLSKGFILGDKITVTEGPLKNQEGLIKKIDRHKRIAWVEMPFLGKTTQIRVPLEIVDKRT